jgi:hypothetical protein
VPPAPSRKSRGAIAFKAHTGWAWGVVVAETDGGIEIAAKRRVTMLDTFETAAVYHVGHERGLSADEARPIIDTAVRASLAAAKAAIAELAASAGQRCSLDSAAILTGSGKPLPSLDAILRSHPLVHAAEGELYRDVLARACEASGLRVVRLPAKELQKRARSALSTSDSRMRAQLDAAGKASGRPWGAEHRECALAAWVALATNISGVPA